MNHPQVLQLQILGTGCKKCRQLASFAEEAAHNLGLELELEKVEDLDAIVELGVVRTPALVVEGEVVSSGRVPAVSEIERLLEPFVTTHV